MKRTIALFDIDGTLLPGCSAETIFIRWLAARGVLTLADGARWVGRFLRTLPRGTVAAAKANKGYLAGKRPETIRAMAADCYARSITPRIPAAARRLVAGHRESGRRIVFLSGTLDCLIERFRDDLGADEAIGSTLLVQDGRYTGDIGGIHPYGGAKAEIARRRWGDGSFDLAGSWAYGDRRSDLALLALFGHPALVDPGRRLAAAANRRGIGIVRL